MGLYKVTGPTPVLDANPGDVFEHDFTPDEEHDLLERGRLALEPRPYKVVGSSKINVDGVETCPGGTFDGAFTIGQEQALLAAAAIERLPLKPTKQPAKRAADKKE